MVAFKVDRASAPKFWQTPLVFHLYGEGVTVAAEIEPDAARIYRWERQGGGSLLGNAITDDFISSVEIAVEQRHLKGSLAASEAIRLRYDELYPA